MFLLLEPCDFERYPPGGQLTMARHLMHAFGPDAALVGFASDNTTPVGQWLERTFDGVTHPFFAIGRRPALAKKPLVPGRLQAFLQLCRHRDAILSIGRLPVFTQSPEALFAAASWPVPSICHRFPGTANSLAISRYPLVRAAAPLYDLALYTTLRQAEVILAAADEESIQALTTNSATLLKQAQVIHFPTRVDATLFTPHNPTSGRGHALRVPSGDVSSSSALLPPTSSLLPPRYITTGRLSHIKGWPLLLDAFQLVQKKLPDATLTFVGDGEDRPKLNQQIETQAVTITGFVPPDQVAEHLQSAGVYVSASYMEGWSLSMLEALACGKPIVTTQVSGAREMIREGVNGYILPTRDPAAYAEAMLKALALNAAAPTSIAIAARYSTATLKQDLQSLWPAINKSKRS